MEIRTIDQAEQLFAAEIEKMLGENRGIEIEWGDGESWDLSSNIAMKYKDSRQVAEKLRDGLSRGSLMIEKLEISEKNHLNIKLKKEWQHTLLGLFVAKGLDICEKKGGELTLHPVSPSKTRLESYRKAMEHIGILRGIKVSFSPEGEKVELGDMETLESMPQEILEIAGISRGNKTDISGLKLSKANDIKNPHFRWSYIDYRLRNVAEILQKQAAKRPEGGADSQRAWDSKVRNAMLKKLKLRKALDEAIRFRDPYKYYSWMEEYLEAFYGIKITREVFTPEIASSLATRAAL